MKLHSIGTIMLHMIFEGVLVMCTRKNRSKQVCSNTHPMLKIFLSGLAVLNLMENALCLFLFMSDL